MCGSEDDPPRPDVVEVVSGEVDADLLASAESMWAAASSDEDDSSTRPVRQPGIPRSQKKLQRREQDREARRHRHREKARETRQRKSAARSEFLATMTEEEQAAYIEQQRALGKERVRRENELLELAFERGRPRILINCSFEDQFVGKELTSLAKQIQWAYAMIKSVGVPAQIHVTSCQGSLTERMDYIGMAKARIHRNEKAMWELFRPEELVVLTPDAEEELTVVDDSLIYVIGGIVDRSVRKRASYDQALIHGLRVVKLPLGSFGPKTAHPCLNINAVAEILMKVHKGGSTEAAWRQAFEECVPQRSRRNGEKNEKKRDERAAEEDD